MKKIVAAIDFSDVTSKIVDEAVQLAQLSKGEIRLIHITPPEPDFIGDDVGPQVLRDQKAEKYREEHKQIQDIADKIKSQQIEITPLLMQGVTVDSIISECKKFDADLIVIGSHGHGAMYNLLMGSVVEGVIKASSVPVLIVPAEKK